jgi:glutamate-ammonia-ligase adenylyltransferase
MAGNPDLAADIEALRLQIITHKGQGQQVLSDVADMRARLAAAKSGQGEWEAKLGAGRMMDIELFAQTLALQTASPARSALDQIAAGVLVGKLSQSDGQDLGAAYTVMARLQTALRLVSQTATGPQNLGAGGQGFVIRSAACLDSFAELAARADTIITAQLARKGDGDATG